MNYKIVSTDPITGESIYALVNENGDYTLTCRSEYEPFQEWVAQGNTPEPADQPDPWIAIRNKRDELIRESDWTMIPGCTVDQAQWAAYRQTLRDIPTTYAETGPESVVWPRKPSTSGPNTIDE